MSDGFDQMLDDALAFFDALGQNNTRDWFEPRKADYVEKIKKPAELMADLLAEDVARITGKPHKPKLFRIHRDVRFSKDKTPYNTHLHLLWSQASGPAYFFGAAPEYCMVGCGIMGLQGAALTQYRAHVDRHGAELAAAIDEVASAAGAQMSDFGPAPLKRVPKPYAADHPYGALLKRKSLAMSADLDADWRKIGLLKAIAQRIEQMRPLWQALGSIADH